MLLGFLSAIAGKIAGVGTAAKATAAVATAGVTMTVAGAAAGVLPAPLQGAVGGAINAVSPLNVPTSEIESTLDTAKGVVEQTVGSVSTTSPVSGSANAEASYDGSSASVSAQVDVSTTPPPTIPGVPPVADVTSLVGNLPVDNLPVALPSCVTNLVPTSGALPNPTALATQIPGCIQTVLASAELPVDVRECVASVLGTISGVVNPAAIGSLPELDMSACAPLDATECTSNVLAATGTSSVPFVGDMLETIFGSFGFGGGGSVGADGASFWGDFGFGLPAPDAVPAGCVPIDIAACLTSVTGALGTLPATGGVPDVNLSACMPTGLSSGIEGEGGGIPGLSGIPFFPFGG